MFIRWSILGFLANYKKERTDTCYLYNRIDEFIIPSSIQKINENITGYDMRYPLTEEMDKDIIRKMEISFAKFRLLAYLENNNISIHNKLSSITNFSKFETGTNYINNITAGGLLKDWNFDFEKTT